MSKTVRSDAWNLLYVTKVNVCYWKSLIRLYQKRVRLAEYPVAGIGLIAAIIIGIAQRNWVTTGVTAISGFLVAVIGGPLANFWSTRDAKKGHERWSQLLSDADVLWRHGEALGWDDGDIRARGAALAEREKQYQAHEYHDPNLAVLDECETRVHSELARGYYLQED